MLEAAVFARDAQSVCAGQKFYDLDGNLRYGSKICEAQAGSTSTSSDTAETLPKCSRDGEIDCRATENLPAAVKQDLAAKLIAGATVVGVTGAVVLPAASDVRQSVAYGPDLSLTGSLSLGSGLPANCSSDGATGCIAVTNFPAVDKINKLTPGNIKTGTTIANVVGAYPSTQYPLIGADSNTADLPAFTSTTGGMSYEWFKSDGTRLTGSIQANATVTPSATPQTLTAGLYRSVTVAGDADLVANKILSGSDIFGVLGTAQAKLADCASDGQIGCTTVAAFPAIDTSSTA